MNLEALLDFVHLSDQSEIHVNIDLFFRASWKIIYWNAFKRSSCLFGKINIK